MARSQRKLAQSLGVAQASVSDAKKSLGIEGKTMTDEEEKLVIDKLQDIVKLHKDAKEKSSRKSDDFVPNVRRIDQYENSSVADMLQDCKEQYVRNEGLIQRLTYEIDLQDILMHGNGNGTLSPLPQLPLLEKFQKVNIALRNQILALEQELGRLAEPRHEDNPFE